MSQPPKCTSNGSITKKVAQERTLLFSCTDESLSNSAIFLNPHAANARKEKREQNEEEEEALLKKKVNTFDHEW